MIDFYLACRMGICFGCGTLYPKSDDPKRFYDRAAHDRVCRKKHVTGIKTDEFTAGISKWRKLFDSGMPENDIQKKANAERVAA